MIRCILFDRDGTLGELVDKRYPQTLVPYCDIAAVFAQIKAKGYKVGIVTNQSSIARGTGKGYDFDKEFAAYGADVWEICPHDNADRCDCRKPKSGLVFAAAKRLGIRAEECLVVGDRLSDVACGFGAGGEGALVLTSNGEAERDAVLRAYPNARILPRFDSLLSLLPL